MFSVLSSLFTSIISGGLTGILGVAVQRFADYKNKQLDIQLNREKFAHEVSLKKADAEIMAQEWAGRTRVADIEATAVESVADSHAFAASFNEPVRYSDSVKPSAGQGWALVVLDFIRGIVRPGLTVYLCILTTLVYFNSRELIAKDGLSPDQSMELVQQVVGTILYLTTSCLLWWFGVRNRGKSPLK